MRIENRVKSTLQAGGVTVGVFVQMPSPDVVELLALDGFDFVMFDGEHGRVSPSDAYPMILAAEARDIEALARVGQNDRQVILKYLDLGIAGVMVPQTHDLETARRAVNAMRYWPRGGRGLAGGRTFDYGVGVVMADRVPEINDRILSLIQFEHIDALPHLDELLALPELDVLFVGPTDLAQSMGYPGQPTHPEVEKIIAQVCERARGSRVALGTVAGDVDLANRRIGQGFRMIVANVPALLYRSSRALLDGIDRGAGQTAR
ncbi:MAG TPA: aldolase/citrate lyase family protein [Thermomicrobiales bacterium]|nr:aldolase/citrate lyase family protein [Thermomicrobiales bacterium]